MSKESAFQLRQSLLLLLTACASEKGASSPEPAELFSNIEQNVSIPQMVDVAGAFLEDELGITAEDYESAVYYLVEGGLAPDEIVIVKAVDEAAAARNEVSMLKREIFKLQSKR